MHSQQTRGIKAAVNTINVKGAVMLVRDMEWYILQIMETVIIAA